jgi:hypothetical protein
MEVFKNAMNGTRPWVDSVRDPVNAAKLPDMARTLADVALSRGESSGAMLIITLPCCSGRFSNTLLEGEALPRRSLAWLT